LKSSRAQGAETSHQISTTKMLKHKHSKHSSSRQVTTTSLESFTNFPRLSNDLRQIVWELTFESRQVELRVRRGFPFELNPESIRPQDSILTTTSTSPNPIALQVNQESRAVALRFYTELFSTEEADKVSTLRQDRQVIYFSSALDTFTPPSAYFIHQGFARAFYCLQDLFQTLGDLVDLDPRLTSLVQSMTIERAYISFDDLNGRFPKGLSLYSFHNLREITFKTEEYRACSNKWTRFADCREEGRSQILGHFETVKAGFPGCRVSTVTVQQPPIVRHSPAYYASLKCASFNGGLYSGHYQDHSLLYHDRAHEAAKQKRAAARLALPSSKNQAKKAKKRQLKAAKLAANAILFGGLPN